MFDIASSHPGRAFEFDIGGGIVSAIITVVLVSLVVRMAARLVIDRGGFVAALLTAIIGSILATLIWGLVGGILGLILAVATWALIAALFFRTDWFKGALIGVVAWVIWLLVSLLVAWLFRIFG